MLKKTIEIHKQHVKLFDKAAAEGNIGEKFVSFLQHQEQKQEANRKNIIHFRYSENYRKDRAVEGALAPTEGVLEFSGKCPRELVDLPNVKVDKSITEVVLDQVPVVKKDWLEANNVRYQGYVIEKHDHYFDHEPKVEDIVKLFATKLSSEQEKFNDRVFTEAKKQLLDQGKKVEEAAKQIRVQSEKEGQILEPFARKNGSELLKERFQNNFSWKPLAKKEYSCWVGEQIGFTCCSEMTKHKEFFTEPNLDQIKAYKLFTEKIKKYKHEDITIELVLGEDEKPYIRYKADVPELIFYYSL